MRGDAAVVLVIMGVVPGKYIEGMSLNEKDDFAGEIGAWAYEALD